MHPRIPHPPAPEQTDPQQPDLFSQPVDADTADVLDLVSRDPIHTRDREAILEAILTAARTHAGRVDPNQVRELIPSWVYPRCVGAMYSRLGRAGYLVPDGWTTSTDVAGKNSGKPLRCWRLVREPHTTKATQ